MLHVKPRFESTSFALTLQRESANLRLWATWGLALTKFKSMSQGIKLIVVAHHYCCFVSNTPTPSLPLLLGKRGITLYTVGPQNYLHMRSMAGPHHPRIFPETAPNIKLYSLEPTPIPVARMGVGHTNFQPT